MTGSDRGSVDGPLRQVALLRGINVGRNKRVSMEKLRQLLGDLGCTEVVTHLQSGNAVFTTTLATAAIGEAIEQAVKRELGIDSKVVVRTHSELVAAVNADPLSEVATDPAKHLLGFLSDAPDEEHLEVLTELIGEAKTGSDQYHVAGSHLYLWCPRGVHDSLFARVDWNKGLGVTTTMRNWRTVTKLVELTRE